MAFSPRPEPIICPECNYEGKSTIKRSEIGYWIVCIVLFVASFFFLFWPLFIVSLIILFRLLFKRADRICPKCRFEIPNPK